MEERLHKLLAAAGVASRREAERMIAAGRVAIDGEVVTEMGVKADPDLHRITVDGRPVAQPSRLVYLLLNKPRGYVTTRSDPHATHTVMELLTEVPVPVHPIGRLDKDTEGVLLFTNDGAFTELLTHPRHAVPKVYVAHVKGVPGDKALERLRNGVRLEDGMTAPAQVRVLGIQDENATLEVILREGRNRQVRRMLEAVGHPVERLRRLAVGPVNARKVPVGCWRYLTQKEIHALRHAATPPEETPAAHEPAGATEAPAARSAGTAGSAPARRPAVKPAARPAPSGAKPAPPGTKRPARGVSTRAGHPAGAKQGGAGSRSAPGKTGMPGPGGSGGRPRAKEKRPSRPGQGGESSRPPRGRGKPPA